MRIFFTCCALFTSVTLAQAGSLSWISQERWVTVDRVVDGDTFRTRKGEKIRLLGINTPETRHQTSSAEPWGKEAKLALETLLAGKQVKLRFDLEKKDKYKRTLAHVYLRDGTWVNAELVKQGMAHVYTFTPNISAAKRLIRVEKQAIADHRGIWSHKRWRVLTAPQLRKSMLGQFRLLRGTVGKVSKDGWRFALGKLSVSIPKKYRSGFKRWHSVREGESVLVRGRLRMSSRGKWFLSVHTPSDIGHKP